MNAGVDVSVIVPAYRDWAALPRCLEALERQKGGVAFETIVVASGVESDDCPLAARFPEVRFLLSHDRKYPGAARNLGARDARGDILLFLDADCELAPDGLRRVLGSHRTHAAPLIGGAIDQAAPAAGIAWGYHFVSLSAWLPRRSESPMPIADLATACYSIKRWAFERFGPFSDLRYCEDTQLCWMARQAGFEVLFDPGIRVSHRGIDRLLPVLRRKFSHGRAFARLRSQTLGWSTARSRIQALAAPLVPLVLLVRAGRAVAQSGRHRRRFALALPCTLAVASAWALGEAAGLWSRSD